jgi:hypothetical protein
MGNATALAIKEHEDDIETLRSQLRIKEAALSALRASQFDVAHGEAKPKIREAVIQVIQRAGRPLTSREINAYIKDVPIDTRSKNLGPLIATTLIDLLPRRQIGFGPARNRPPYIHPPAQSQNVLLDSYLIALRRVSLNVRLLEDQ